METLKHIEKLQKLLENTDSSLNQTLLHGN